MQMPRKPRPSEDNQKHSQQVEAIEVLINNDFIGGTGPAGVGAQADDCKGMSPEQVDE